MAKSGVDLLLGINNKVQQVQLSGGDGSDTYNLVFEGITSSQLSESDTPGQVQTVLESNSNISVGDVNVFGSAGSFKVEFQGNYFGEDVGTFQAVNETDALNVNISVDTTFAVIAGQRSTTLNLEPNNADATSKDCKNWQQQIVVNRDWSFECENLIVNEGSPVHNALKEAFFSNKKLLVQVNTPGNNHYRGRATVTRSEDAPHDDIYSGTVTVEGDGELEKY